jgi:hypothetical protein
MQDLNRPRIQSALPYRVAGALGPKETPGAAPGVESVWLSGGRAAIYGREREYCMDPALALVGKIGGE